MLHLNPELYGRVAIHANPLPLDPELAYGRGEGGGVRTPFCIAAPQFLSLYEP